MTHINSNHCDELLLNCLFGKISLIIFYLIFHCFNYPAQNKKADLLVQVKFTIVWELVYYCFRVVNIFNLVNARTKYATADSCS